MKLRNIMLSGLVITMLATAPAFAKENGKGNNGKGENDDNEAKTTKVVKVENNNNINKNDNGCFRAFGHFIAPGWIKHNGNIDLGTECHFPFGIGKKFHGNNATTTPDVTAPVISSVASKPAKNQAAVTWSTDELSDSALYWSTTTPVDTSLTSGPNVIFKNNFTKKHQIVIRKLMPGTTYYAVVRSRDFAGNTKLSDTISFTTNAPSVDTQPPVISTVVTLTGSTTIQVGWKTNENATGRVYYSTILPVVVNASSTSFADEASTTKNHSVSLNGLTQNTTYYLVIESTDGAGNTSTSATFSAHTSGVVPPPPPPPADVTPPVISVVSATSTASTTGNVTWTTDEAATSKVFYSTTSPVDTSASTTPFVLNASLVTSHSIALSGLTASTTYFVTVQSADASNNVQTTSGFSLTTPGI